MDPDELPGDEITSWAAFHASHQPVNVTPKSNVAIASLLPLFYDPTHSEAINGVKMAVEILNPNQVSIITLDQPLHAIAKQIQ